MKIADMLKQAQSMQAKLADMQATLEAEEVVGGSGGGLVRVTLNGKGVMRGLAIDPSLMVADEREVLEDLIVAAHADAKTRAEALVAEKMGAMTGGMGLPPGLKLPF